LLILIGSLPLAAQAIENETVDGIEIVPRDHDFGHVGIDYRLACDFLIISHRPDTINISELVPDCDCTRVWTTDSTLTPGDTILIKSTFSTKDYYGPTGRPFSIYFAEPKTPVLVLWQRAIVGQWNYGLKPDPISLFFLPGQKSRNVVVRNQDHESIRVSFRQQVDTLFDVTFLGDEASKGEQVEIEVVVRPDLKAGTYHTNFSLEVSVEGGARPAILTVPVKIVRY
jgi:hypothetical protein